MTQKTNPAYEIPPLTDPKARFLHRLRAEMESRHVNVPELHRRIILQGGDVALNTLFKVCRGDVMPHRSTISVIATALSIPAECLLD